ncbi:Protein kinase DC2 [Eumeta japonica]|uniref:Protein kinase DC2 n=1 Tax=Eumeta variegata TaxID=151549 RepID=A0A4C1VTH4_EUMVA|nr:Protein kinase DC2 [Eumeta japonica]
MINYTIAPGTGTFGRVCLCRDKAADEYLAMKILAMADVIRLKQVDHVMNEKSILAEINHPFIVNLRWWTHDDACIYMLFDYVCGGELFSYLRNAGRFSNSTAPLEAGRRAPALSNRHFERIGYYIDVSFTCCARGRPIIVEWERDARHSAGLSLVRLYNSERSWRTMQEFIPRNKIARTCRPRSEPTPRLPASSRSSAATRDIYTRVDLNCGADARPARLTVTARVAGAITARAE